MLYNAYQDTSDGICGVSVVSCGHIFAQKGRKIDRPNGRSDFLLFYVAKGKEHFFFDDEVIADKGDFVLFRPFEKQKHIYKENQTGEFYYVHFNAPADFDLFGMKSSFVYNSKPSATICSIFEEIISELQKKQPAYELFCASKLFNLFAFLSNTASLCSNTLALILSFSELHSSQAKTRLYSLSQAIFHKVLSSLTFLLPPKLDNG